MSKATHSGIAELARFARGLQDGLIAIKAGLTLEWLCPEIQNGERN